MTPPRPLLPLLLLSLAMASCGGSGGGGDGPPDAGLDGAGDGDADADADTDAGTELHDPRIVFLAPAADGSAQPVTSILYARLAWVRVEDLEPGTEATLRSSLWGYRGWARFTAAADGTVDTSRDAPDDGTYEGVEPEGLVWSMTKESDETASNYDVRFDLELDGAVVTSQTLERRPLDDGLRREVVRDQGLVGVLYEPTGDGPLPAVLVLGGSEGGIPELSAAFQGSLGVAAFALGYFGAEGLPPRLTDIALETFGDALAWLAARPEIDPDRIAVSGGSRGGELALQIAALYPDVAATIAQVPSGIRWGSASEVGRAAWTLDDAPLPYLDGDEWGVVETEWLPNDDRGVRYAPAYLATIDAADPADVEAATIEVDQATGPILLVGGADDGLWPSCPLAQIALDRLTASGHADSHEDELLCLPDAGHLIGMPGWPTAESYAIADPFGGPWWVLGGTPGGTARAQRTLFDATRAFWGRTLGLE